jgi:hypothetical protein
VCRRFVVSDGGMRIYVLSYTLFRALAGSHVRVEPLISDAFIIRRAGWEQEQPREMTSPKEA